MDFTAPNISNFYDWGLSAGDTGYTKADLGTNGLTPVQELTLTMFCDVYKKMYVSKLRSLNADLPDYNSYLLNVQERLN